MKKYLSLLTIVIFSLTMLAQEVDFPNKKQLLKGSYEAVEKDIVKHLEKTPDDVMYLYAAVQLYNTPEYAGRSIEKAYQYACKAKDKYNRLAPEDQDKLEKKGLTKEVLNTSLMEVCTAALEAAKAVNTDEAYAAFLHTYSRSVPSLKRQAEARRNTLAFESAAERNTIGSYTFFIQNHPEAKEVKEAVKRRNALAFEQAKSRNNVAAFQEFINQYPDAEQVEQAQQAIYALAYRDVERTGDAASLDKYMQEHPESPHGRAALLERARQDYAAIIRKGDWRELKTRIQEVTMGDIDRREIFYALMLIARNRMSVPAAAYGYQNAPGEDMRDTCWMVMHDVAISTGKSEDVQALYQQFPNSRMTELQAFDEAMIRKSETLNTTGGSPKQFILQYAPYTSAFMWMMREAAPALQRKDWAMALESVEQYEEAFGKDEAYNNILRVLRNTGGEDLYAEAFPEEINTPNNEYSPVMTADENTLYFVSTGRKENIGGEDIFYSERQEDGTWAPSMIVPGLNTIEANEAMQSVSADGTKLIFFRSGILYTTTKQADGWAEPKPLPNTINISTWQSDAMITSDGKALLFSSEKQVENELKPSVNIFVSQLDENGEWGEPIDLGPTINTPGLERKPFLHPDMHTLYFSSEGHGSIGALDVYMTTRLSDDSWTEWSPPVNVGVLINSVAQDWGYKITTDGMRAYYSNGKDLYMLDLPESMRPNAVATISGRVHNDKGEAVSVTIRWENLETHEEIGESQTDPANGSFYLVLPLKKNYGYYIDDEEYFPISSNIDLRDVKKSVKITRDIQLTSYRQMIEQGVAVQVNNLFFPVNEWELLPESESELIRVAQIIKAQKVKVEISGHTDSSGDPKKNQVLSRQRAESVRTFLIQQGCSADMLTAKGYGATKPIADNTTDEGKQLNRRVELRFTDK